MNKTCVVLLSGGIDSTVLLRVAAHRRGMKRIIALALNYGQSHREREIACARWQALALADEGFDVSYREQSLPLAGIVQKGLLSRSTKGGRNADEQRTAAFVPARNAILLSVAWAAACSDKASRVLIGVQSGEGTPYPDCTEHFIAQMQYTLRVATEGMADPDMVIEAPFHDMTKETIIRLGASVNTDFSHTWSCFEGGEQACGRCGACRKRADGFAASGLKGAA